MITGFKLILNANLNEIIYILSTLKHPTQLIPEKINSCFKMNPGLTMD
jgi:hypothetical protein